MSDISESDAIFARAYASAIKTKFQLDVGQHDCILTSPVTLRGMAAGNLIYPQMTNYLIYKFADALQYADNPSYTGGSAGSYIQQLRSYIDWVKAKSYPSQVVVDRMAKARNAFTASNDNYFKVLTEAQTQFSQVKELYPGQTFWQWAASNYPLLAAADRTRKSAQTELFQAMQAYFGPDAAVLSGTYMSNIENAQGPIALPGYNQDGLLDDRDLIDKAIRYANSGVKPPPEDIAQSTIRVPAYTIPSYVSWVQSLITASGNGATRDQVITIDVNQGKKTSWEDYGFKEVKGGGSVGFWPFFSAEVNVNNKWETRTLNTSGRENAITMQLAMIGIQKFDIQSGQWDVANIKTLFPNRLPDAPDVLSSKYARIVSVLVGYDVELKLEFASEMREEVNRIYEEVKKTGGSMSIFGFRVSAGAGGGSTEHVETKFEDVKWDKAKGTMSLTPTEDQVYPTILGAVAQRFD
ncbi:hypothetical protein BT96DRAFT_980533 [Gymnopus androsaceus JB14]|uniref:Uncharacterized protein n=1 Tax=Gymnopus androsaceus JB14 TaxID=1447944 RepID=A0A6A4GWW1_9AGAR|nr:hypothetical protein BT96DRAFT_980533 [Gymnopus androsaceus JB14]